MANTGEEPSPLPITSYQTALCVIPPRDRCENINRLRPLYDQAYGRWPAHVNLLYPFVPPNNFAEAAERIRDQLASENHRPGGVVPLRLDEANYFSQRQGKTVHIAPSERKEDGEEESGLQWLQFLRDSALRALGQWPQQRQDTGRRYNPHLTIGQTKSHDTDARDYLLDKARLLLPVEWEIQELAILGREPSSSHDSSPSKMRVLATVDVSGGSFDITWKRLDRLVDEEGSAFADLQIDNPSSPGDVGESTSRTTYAFDAEDDIWKPALKPTSNPYADETTPATFAISSYNVLVEPYRPGQDRHPVLVRNILSKAALADVLVLQEVSDDFLSYLLNDDEVRQIYPFTTHGPPKQKGLGPLPSLLNIVVISRHNFSWHWVPFEARHKGTVILEMDGIGKYDDSDNFFPLVLAGVHLSSGLTDNTITAKKSQIQSLLGYLSKSYPENPYIIAGDFNITTSMFSINKALKQQRITRPSYDNQLGLESTLAEAGLSDAWNFARTGVGGAVEYNQDLLGLDDLYEGEQGATFDPRINPLAMESARTGYARPERYDRILAKERGFLHISGFNMFGSPNEARMKSSLEGEQAASKFGSDHWGIRAAFRLSDDHEEELPMDVAFQQTLGAIQKAPRSMASPESLESCLAECGMLPSDEEIQKRKEVFELIKSILAYGFAPGVDNSSRSSRPSTIPTIVVPVGSHGLGVWNSQSDIDCLCISSMSSKTFFKLAVQRLSGAADSGVRILRKVKAATGTMLEIDVGDIKLDVQYCPAARIVERWPEVTRLPPNDPLFDLPIHSLSKLQPFRDLNTIQRTVPDLATFRTAHRFIHAWAKQRGIYAAKFGYLGGIHITIMLSRVCKLYYREASVITAADVICTFFKHYADFDWNNEILYDPFFFKGKKPRYRRYVNEPMVILTMHAPVVNIARTISVPSRRTIVGELKRASELLSGHDGVSWSCLMSGIGDEEDIRGSDEFLKAYNSYVKVNVQYWGLSLAKGSALVGWLESRCLRLLVDLDTRLPGIHTQVWPARFTHKDNSDASSFADNDDREYQGCYLIGLVRRNDSDEEKEPMSKEKRKRANESLQTALERFTSQIQAEDKYFDPSLCWVDATHVKQSDLVGLTVDKREWGRYVVHDAVSDDSDEDSEDSDEEEDDEDVIYPETESHLAGTTTPTGTVKVKSAKAKGAAKKFQQQAQQPRRKPASKLRPASDILNRLRWDPSFDAANYVIGYEDRFLGVKETPLERWKGEQTDEEFIPLHRVVYFRRRTDGGIVWDRRSRRDVIFGSGNGDE